VEAAVDKALTVSEPASQQLIDRKDKEAAPAAAAAASIAKEPEKKPLALATRSVLACLDIEIILNSSLLS
jgi:hypothetical protein